MNSLHFIARLGILGAILISGLVSSTGVSASSTSNVMAFQYAELNNCVIPVGSSTCVTTLVIYGPSGMTYTVQNVTRGITSSNIITPNNFIPYNGGYAYVLKDTLLSDAANRLTHGENIINVFASGTSVASFRAIGSGMCASGSSWNGQICASTVITPPNYFVTIDSKNCTIPLGKSTCPSTVSVTSTKYIGTTGGRMFDLKNLTRNLTTTNLFTPSNTTLNSAGYPVYTVSTHITGDAANYGLNGVNDFVLIEGGVAVAKSSMTATCATGSTWNGQICAEPAPVYVDFQVNNCVIPAGKSTCHAAVFVGGPTGRTYTLENITRAITSTNIITPNNYSTTLGKYFLDPAKTVLLGDTANNLKYGMNYLKLKLATLDSTNLLTIGSATADASCATGSTWNGQICAANPPPTAPLTIACSKPSYTVGEAISCKITGGMGVKTCWQTGTTSTSEKNCVDYGWIPSANGLDLTYRGIASTAAIGTYTLYTKDSAGKIATTQVSYTQSTTVAPMIRATNCTIAIGKSTCVSTVTMIPVPAIFYSLENTTRGLTMTNAFRPGVSTISTSVLGEQASNYLTNGTNILVARGGSVIARTQATATCAVGSTWNGQMCAATKSPPIACTLEVRYCEDQSIMPRDPNTCEWLPGQCPLAYPVTRIIFNDIIVNDVVLDYTGSTIVIPANATLSLKGMTRPGGMLYFSREGQSNYESVGASSTTGEWELRNIWSPAGASIVIPGEYTYKITGLPPGTQSSFYSPEVLVKIKVVSSSTNENNVLFSARNCVITAGKSTCASTVSVTSTKYKGTTGGRMFDMRNATRNLTTTNLFTPNNTTLNADGYPVYTVGVNSAGDAANYATYGANDFILIEGGTNVAKASMTATCATGSSWNGKICASTIVPPTLSGGVITVSGALVARMTNCIIPEGKSTCPVTILVFAQSGKTFSVNNITRGVSSLDLIKPIHFLILRGRSVYVYRDINSPNYANNLTFGSNTLTITEKGIANIGVTVKASASCATGKQWNGSICIAPPPTVFSAKSYTTAQGTKTLSGGSILFRPEIDKTLTLNGVGPYGAIEVLQGDGVMLRTDSIDTSGKWEFSVNPSFLAGKSSLLLTIWDGKNTSTQTRVQIYNASSTTQVSISNTTGVLTTKLVDLAP